MREQLNRFRRTFVPLFVRLLAGTSAAFLVLAASSCSSSRTIGAASSLPANSGNHIMKTVMKSDLHVPPGAALAVDYSSESRFFVQKGGALSGFPKGARLTTVYAEKGALVPNAQGQEGLIVKTVSDARKSFQTRHQELPPAGMQVTGPRGAVVVPTVGVGFWGGWGGWGWRGGGARFSRPVSVRPSGYRRSQ
jgi:hypothetical protein